MSDAPSWQVAVRFLTLGVLAMGIIMSFWLMNRLADRIETQTQLLLGIQRDVLVNQQQVGTVLASDAKLTEALIRLQTLVDAIHDPQFPDDEPGPKSRPRLKRQ